MAGCEEANTTANGIVIIARNLRTSTVSGCLTLKITYFVQSFEESGWLSLNLVEFLFPIVLSNGLWECNDVKEELPIHQPHRNEMQELYKRNL